MNQVATPPSVVHVVAPAAYGGLETVVLTLARGQLDVGQRVTVVALVDTSPVPHPWVRALGEAGVPVRTISTPARGYRAERQAVQNVLRELQPDVMHSHGYRTDVVDSGVAKAMGIRIVTTAHGFVRTGWKNLAYEWIQRRWFRRFDAVVAVSDKLRQELVASGVPSERAHTIRNAWKPTVSLLDRGEARSLLGLDPGATVVSWVGRLSPEKGPDVMIRTLAASGDPGVRLSMIGTGSLEPELRRLAAQVGLEGRVRWHGAVPDAGRYLAAFDAVLLTSWTEGTPMILLEAMAAGVPVVTTDVGGIPDVVSNGEAILVPAGDVQALAGGIQAVLGDPMSSGKRVEAARTRLETDFSVAPWVARYSDLYTSILS